MLFPWKDHKFDSSNELQTCDWPRNVFCKHHPSTNVANAAAAEESSSGNRGDLEDNRNPRKIEQSAASYDDFGQKKVTYTSDAILEDQEITDSSVKVRNFLSCSSF